MGQGGASAQGTGGFSSLVPIILMFVIFYFLLIRPQQKKAKEHQQMVSGLKKGDRIITSGGIYGLITSVGENVLTVEISDKVRIKLVKSNVTGLASHKSQARVAKSNKSDSNK